MRYQHPTQPLANCPVGLALGQVVVPGSGVCFLHRHQTLPPSLHQVQWQIVDVVWAMASLLR